MSNLWAKVNNFVATIFIYLQKEMIYLNLQELCIALSRSPSTLMTNFKRTQEAFAKKGIIITKQGEGKNAIYLITYEKEDINNA